MPDPTCSVCSRRFSAPVSLPCGHIFCTACIRRSAVPAEAPTCPTCQAPFPLLNLDPALVPPYLRPHIQPPLRPVYFDSEEACASTSTSPTHTHVRSLPTPPPTDAGTDTDTEAGISSPAELVSGSAPPPLLSHAPSLTPIDSTILVALHAACATWRRRAETHAAGNMRLLGLARSARDCALRLRADRDAARNECVLLRRRIMELLQESASIGGADHGVNSEDGDADGEEELHSPSPFAPPRWRTAPVRPPAPPREGPPMFVMQYSGQTFEQLEPDVEAGDMLGPPMKRRREDDDKPATVENGEYIDHPHRD